MDSVGPSVTVFGSQEYVLTSPSKVVPGDIVLLRMAIGTPQSAKINMYWASVTMYNLYYIITRFIMDSKDQSVVELMLL